MLTLEGLNADVCICFNVHMLQIALLMLKYIILLCAPDQDCDACLLALQAESKLVFVPSMSDAGPAAILPRPPLPEPLIADARELLPNAVFASNPCRIRFYNQVRHRLPKPPPSPLPPGFPA